MHNIRFVLQFGWNYLRRYRVRLAAGVLLGVLFGLTNASFVWATRTLTERLEPEQPAAQTRHAERSSRPTSQAWRQRMTQLNTTVQSALDGWLPRVGRALDWRQALGGLLLLPLLVSLRGGSGFGSAYCMSWVSERVVNDLRFDVLTKLSTLSLDYFNRSKSGDLLTRISGDTAALQRTLRIGFTDLIKEAVTILSVFGALCLIDWKLTLLSMIFLPLCLAPLLVLGRKARKASRAGLKASVTQFSQLVELVNNIRVVKAFNLEQEQLDRFRLLSQQMIRQEIKGVKAKELVNPVIEVVSTLAVGGLIVFLFATQRTVSDLVGFLTGLFLFYAPVKRLAAIHVLFEQTSVGVQRLIETFHEQPSVQSPSQPKPLTRFQTGLVFRHVSFAYRHEPVLRDIQFSLPRGFKLGVAGPSGSGKSTLVNLLFRFYDPTSGAILIDGLDLREVSKKDLRQLMALVSQEITLFDLTVAENIALGRRRATRADIQAAAEAAYAHEFIMQMPEGYDTRIGERGVVLSGGQRQRLAIARAFVRNAPILVLDEATAALDSQAEGEVQAAIERLEENRTVLCVAHRLSTLAGMDRIVVLSEGCVIEEGGFDELLRRGGAFAAMARRQGILAPHAGVGLAGRS